MSTIRWTLILDGLLVSPKRRTTEVARREGGQDNKCACTFYLVFKEPRRPFERVPPAGQSGVRGTFQLYDSPEGLSSVKCVEFRSNPRRSAACFSCP